MRETTKADLSRLATGDIFGGDELVIFIDERIMTTIRKTKDEEITRFHYDIDIRRDIICNNDRNEFSPEDSTYRIYRKKLAEAGLWV